MLCPLFPTRIVTLFVAITQKTVKLFAVPLDNCENHQKYNADCSIALRGWFNCICTCALRIGRWAPAVVLGVALCAALYTALSFPIRCCVLYDADRCVRFRWFKWFGLNSASVRLSGQRRARTFRCVASWSCAFVMLSLLVAFTAPYLRTVIGDLQFYELQWWYDENYAIWLYVSEFFRIVSAHLCYRRLCGLSVLWVRQKKSMWMRSLYSA